MSVSVNALAPMPRAGTARAADGPGRPGQQRRNGVRAPAVGRVLTGEQGKGFTLTIEGHELSVSVAESLEEMSALRDPWTELLSSSASTSAFLTWEWLYTWAERFIRGDRRLFVVVVSDGRRPVAIAPWYIDRVAHGPISTREVGFLGLPEAGSDYLDVIARRGRERLAAHALIAVLFGDLSSTWDTLTLRDVPAESIFLAHVMARLRRTGKHYATEEGSFCPGIRLPRSFDAYLGQLSSHGRQAYRRKTRALLAHEGVSHLILRDERDLDRGLQVLRELYEKRWGASRVSADLFSALAAYVPRAREGWRVEISLLSVGDRPVAGLLHLTRSARMYQYLMAVDRSFNRPLSVGTLICGMNIRAAIEAGFSEYDFLKTDEDYKFQLMNCGRRALNLRLHNRTLPSLVAWTAGAAARFGKILLR